MNRSIFLAAALFLAVPWSTAAQQGSSAAGTKGTATPEKGADKSKSKTTSTAPEKSADTAASKKTTTKKGKAAEPTGPAPDIRARARRTRSTFQYAVESCERAGNRCDPALRDEAEQRYLEACGACAPSEKCKAERDAIRRGETRSAASDPCALK